MIEMPIARVAAAYAANRGGALAMPTPAVSAVGSAAPAAGPEAAAASDFGTFLDRQIADAVETLKESERVSMSAVAGKASAQEVVRAVLAAEMTVQSVVAIRDKMVQAYQEIMRMGV
ncbi:flagellar hook-basal body complex protein FliE [Azospirillum halopraeferens]|uniref:flagellar hook-basal body complex protein FliE n=1 Tax=Azospirillum halopraeferens TaxID=34010 RepID=UPI0003FD5ED2|nr:flagellar hook-basal body complex protein FliE [Azospirillum halopraeferens]